jgi:hypothetical protein
MVDETNDQENGAPASETTPETLRNVKSEFDRKLGNIERTAIEANARLQQQMEQFLAAIKPAPPQAGKEEDLADLALTDPKRYAEVVRKQAEDAADRKIDSFRSEQSSQAARNQTLTQLVNDFPELADANTELYKMADSELRKVPVNQQTPAMIKAAILDAASELGLQKVSKRKRHESDDNESFSLGGSGSSNSRSEKREKKGTIDERTLMWSELLGRDPNDPKVKAGLEKAVKRKSYSSYK